MNSAGARFGLVGYMMRERERESEIEIEIERERERQRERENKQQECYCGRPGPLCENNFEKLQLNHR